MKPSRVNKDYLTPEKLKEAAQKRKMEYVSPLGEKKCECPLSRPKIKVDMSTCKWR